MIKLLVLDIDGVLTDGTTLLFADGKEAKRIAFHDLDAIAQARRNGIKVAFLTGEAGDLVDTLVKRFGVDAVIAGAKDKATALRDLAGRFQASLAETCYVGDADRDAPALALAAFSFAVQNATPAAKKAAKQVLEKRGGEGVVADVLAILASVPQPQAATAASSPSPMADQIKSIVGDSIVAKQRLFDSGCAVLGDIAAKMATVIAGGHKVLIFGNGGSAADAQHVAGEMVGRFAVESPPWPVIALTTDTSILTCVANDRSYDLVFARQVRALARTGDLVCGISTSGKSKNVLRGLETARELGAQTIGFCGEDPGPMGPLSDLCYAAPARYTPRIQELHLTAWHAVCEVVERELMRGK